ncbi:MAG: hypothetical protein ACOC2Q_03560 [Spirochaetota bacterium]
MSSLAINKGLWVLTALSALVASVVGVVHPAVYEGVVDPAILPGVFTQDLLVLIAAAILLVLALAMKEDSHRSRIVGAGILGFFFYAYGIYSIEQVYTFWYYLYLLVFALSFYSLIYLLVTFDYTAVALMDQPPAVRYLCGGYSIFVAIMFTIIWTARLFPLLETGDRIEYLFSIFIIDLVFVMPAMAIAGVLAARRRPLGIVGVPALFVLGVGILSPLALAELIKPMRYGMPTVPEELWLYLALSVVFAVLTGIFLKTLRRNS